VLPGEPFGPLRFAGKRLDRKFSRFHNVGNFTTIDGPPGKSFTSLDSLEHPFAMSDCQIRHLTDGFDNPQEHLQFNEIRNDPVRFSPYTGNIHSL
jgi:hypothetical protein